jgi:hypothetical protein
VILISVAQESLAMELRLKRYMHLKFYGQNGNFGRFQGIVGILERLEGVCVKKVGV